MRDVADVDLLRIDLETLWVRDERGRLMRTREPGGRAAPHLVIATAADGRIVEIGSSVPDALADELRSTVDKTPLEVEPSAAPAALAGCLELLRDAVAPVDVAGGPHYWIPPGASFACDVTIVRSSVPGIEWLRDRNPSGANWRDDEWRELLAGALGPWALAIVEDRVAAICHSARLWDRGASAGVWTHPEHRGRGYAAAVTAAWARLVDDGVRQVFYSTSADNQASQRVAAKLRLRRIGWTWQVRPTG